MGFSSHHYLYQDIRLGSLTVSSVTVVNVLPNRNWAVSSHSHLDYEFHMIPKGKGFITIEGKNLVVNSGEFYITGPHVMHAQKADPSDPMAEYCLQCGIYADNTGKDVYSLPDQENQMLIDVLSKPYPVIFKDDHGISRLFEEIFLENELHEAGYTIKLQLLVTDILMNIFRSVLRSEGLKYTYTITNRSINKLRSEQLLRFIQANYKNNLHLQDAAQALYLSERQINRLMQSEFGTTFHRYILSYKISLAKKMLAETNRTIEDIAEQCGFSSTFCMYQVFKRYGLPAPAQMRISIVAKNNASD